jgi:hypothetical protein
LLPNITPPPTFLVRSTAAGNLRGGVDLGGEGSEGVEEAEHELVVLRGVERAERAVPLAVQEADAVAVEDVEHLRVGARARAGRRRRRRGDIRRDGGQRRAAEELHRRICGRRGEADLRTGRTGGEFFDANEAHRNAAFF